MGWLSLQRSERRGESVNGESAGAKAALNVGMHALTSRDVAMLVMVATVSVERGNICCIIDTISSVAYTIAGSVLLRCIVKREGI